MSLIVEYPGMLSILVDAGRDGYQRIGITVGGPADSFAFKWANALCGNTIANKEHQICIETIGIGARFTAAQDCEISVTGAVTELKLKDKKLSGWRNFWINKGDSFEITKADNGLRSYIAVATGFNVQSVFGSATTVLRDRLGGLDTKGSMLKAQDILPINAAQTFLPRCMPSIAIPNYAESRVVRVIAGYQISEFSLSAITCFQSNMYKVNAQSDRMATRFSGTALKTNAKSLLSEGLCRGSVQIPPDGIPIAMLSDRQTMGGYPKIGTVLSCDCDALSQMQAGNEIRFELISVYDAQNILQLKQQRFLKLLEGI